MQGFFVRIWNTSPLWFIGAALAAQAAYLPFSMGIGPAVALMGSMALVLVMAYGQNWSYSLSSRSAMRDSNVYHLGAALFGSFTFFVTFRYLFLRDMPAVLFLAYLFATVLGSVHGQTVSMFIERKLGLDLIASKVSTKLNVKKVAKEEKGREFFRFWPSVVVLLIAFVVEITWLHRTDSALLLSVFVAVTLAACFIWIALSMIQRVIAGGRVGMGWLAFCLTSIALGVVGWQLHVLNPASAMLVAVLLFSMPDSFLHAVLRVARSSDHYWFHLGASLLKMGFGFLQLMVLYQMDFTWTLFLPMATGSMLGSLTGATFGSQFAKRINAGFDEHVRGGRNVGWPRAQMYLLIGGGVAIQLIAFGLFQWQGVLILTALAFAQSVSFTLISRSRQRDNKQYIAWASVGSNGIWYAAMHQLVLGNFLPFQVVPYVAGSSAGNLIGQGTALKVERVLGAVMVQEQKKEESSGAKPVRATS